MQLRALFFWTILFIADQSYGQATLAQPVVRRIDGTTIALARLDTVIPRVMKQAGVIGLNIAIINGAQPVYERVFGLRDREQRLPVTSETIFEAASLTKPVFAYLVMSLVKDKLLTLDTPLYQYLEYKDIAHDARHKSITARMVLSHSSGLPNGRSGCRMEFVYTPGQYFNYSAEGIFYLQLVVEHLLKQKLETAIRERVFLPLAMSHSSLVWTSDIEKNYATGYDYFEKRVDKWKPDKGSATATLHTTAGDYGRFLQEMMTGHVLGQDYLNQMLTPQIQVIRGDSTLFWSLGFGVDHTTEQPAYYQWGSNLGVQNFVLFYPRQKLGVVYFTNGEHGLQIKDDILALTVGGRYSTDKFLTYDQYNSLTRQLTRTYDQQGLKSAVALYNQFRQQQPDKLTNRQLDELAAHSYTKGHYKDAANLLMINTGHFPSSWKTYVSLADAYLKLGDRKRYRASLLEAIRYCPTPELLLTPLQQIGTKWR